MAAFGPTISLLRLLKGGAIERAGESESIAGARRVSFVLLHALCGGLPLVALAAYAAFAADVDPVAVTALAWLSLQAAIALLVAAGGELALGHALSAANLATLVGFVAWHTGGTASAILPWLLVVPIEAALSASRRAVAGAIALAGSVLVLLAASGEAIPASDAAGDPMAIGIVGLGSALAYLGALALTIDGLQRRSQGAIAESEARYRLLADNADDLITAHDKAGTVTLAAGAAERLVGIAPERLVGKGLGAHVHRPDRPVYLAALRRAVEAGEAAVAEFRIKSEAGNGNRQPARWVEMSLRPISAVSGVVAITRDVSRRKAQEKELRRAHDEAERSGRIKTHFLANVSHELRTPLNAIIGFAEVLKRRSEKSSDDSAGAEHAGLIHESGQHMLRIVDDLLDLSRIEIGEFPLAHEAVDVAELIRGAIGELAAEVEAARVSVRVETIAGPVPLVVEADARALRQIALHLLANAIRFSRRGDAVEVQVRHAIAGAEIVIQDRGTGIEPGLLARLGMPFVQGEAGHNRNQNGTGLGLCIVKGLVNLHNGKLRIASEPGAGTAVTVWLPRRPIGVAARERALARPMLMIAAAE